MNLQTITWTNDTPVHTGSLKYMRNWGLSEMEATLLTITSNVCSCMNTFHWILLFEVLGINSYCMFQIMPRHGMGNRSASDELLHWNAVWQSLGQRKSNNYLHSPITNKTDGGTRNDQTSWKMVGVFFTQNSESIPCVYVINKQWLLFNRSLKFRQSNATGSANVK